ncbi:hypothetical protein EE612_044456, partial [Oryza sativa]
GQHKELSVECFELIGSYCLISCYLKTRHCSPNLSSFSYLVCCFFYES